MNILEEIAEKTRRRVEKEKKEIPAEEMRRMAESRPPMTGFPFERALRTPGLSFICEVKRASPSRGVIAEEFPFLEIAAEYERAGAAAISCLTEPDYFLGRKEYLREIAAAAEIPVLRKDFIVDPYMIWEAKTLGASAILLICGLLPEGVLREYILTAHSLGLSALTETHSEQEIEMALRAGACVLGVNNRNLKTFEVDVKNSVRLRKMVPEEVLFVSESGIFSREDVEILERNGTDAVLIGESLMKARDKAKELDRLRGKEE